MSQLPEFIHDHPEPMAQPWTVREQGPFVAIIQWDGAGEQQHWVLIPKAEMDEFYSALLDAEEGRK